MNFSLNTACYGAMHAAGWAFLFIIPFLAGRNPAFRSPDAPDYWLDRLREWLQSGAIAAALCLLRLVILEIPENARGPNLSYELGVWFLCTYVGAIGRPQALPRPTADSRPCPCCRGTGRQRATLSALSWDAGPCSRCHGLGYLPPETPAPSAIVPFRNAIQPDANGLTFLAPLLLPGLKEEPPAAPAPVNDASSSTAGHA